MIRLAAAAAVISGLIAVTSPTPRPDVVVVAGRPSVTTATPAPTTTSPPATSSSAPTTTVAPVQSPAPATSGATATTKARPRSTSSVPRGTVPPTSAPAGHWTCPAAVAAMAYAGAPAATLRTWDAIAWRESRCQLSALRAVGGDYSVCWFQIEYGHGLAASRTARFGTAASLRYSASACANAAMALWRSAGWSPWS